jgi:hypothetical protein
MVFFYSLCSPSDEQGNVLRMQIAHRKTQTDHKMLSDRTEALAARVDALQADLCGVMREDDEVEALRTRMQAAENQLSELQSRLSAAEVAIAEAKAQAGAQAQETEQAVEVVATEVSTRTHAPSALCAYTAQSNIAPVTTMTTTPMCKRKRTEDESNEDGGDVEEEEEEGNPIRARRPKQQARKRARRCARAAVHTSAAIVVGAVAAWSALAFV